MPTDAVKAGPKNYKVLFEDKKVRVLEFKGKRGDKIPMHSHPEVVAYAVTDLKVKMTSPDGKSDSIAMSAGMAMHLDGMSHSIEVSAGGHAILVELKK